MAKVGFVYYFVMMLISISFAIVLVRFKEIDDTT